MTLASATTAGGSEIAQYLFFADSPCHPLLSDLLGQAEKDLTADVVW
jgi:hypothetical protein